MTYGFMYYQNEIKWANWCIDKLKKRFDTAFIFMEKQKITFM